VNEQHPETATGDALGSPAAEPAGGWKRRVKLVLFAAAPAVLLLLIGHVFASVATYRELEFRTDSLTGVSYYHMQVSNWPWVEPTTTRLNTRGFPDVEYSTLPPKGGCTRIVFTGDSFTFGDASNGADSWVSLVRDRISTAYPGKCIQVFNLAAPMTTIEQQAMRVRETLPVLQPDFIVLGQYQNDITDLTIPGSIAYRPATDGQQSTFWGDRLRTMTPGFDSPLPRMLTYRVLEFMGENRIKWDLLKRWSVLADTSSKEMANTLTAIYGAMYDSLVTEVRARGIGFAVVIFPSKMDIVAQRYPEGVYFTELAREHAVPMLDLYPVLDARRKPFPYLTYDGHFNILGNRIAAEQVFDWLFLSDSAPFPRLREGLPTPAPHTRVKWWPQPLG
jgi:hypothetical protein